MALASVLASGFHQNLEQKVVRCHCVEAGVFGHLHLSKVVLVDRIDVVVEAFSRVVRHLQLGGDAVAAFCLRRLVEADVYHPSMAVAFCRRVGVGLPVVHLAAGVTWGVVEQTGWIVEG